MMEPLLLRKRGAVQLTYDLPHQIYSTKVYPVPAPNGSTIIVCGLETGLRIIWRGGRPYKTPKSAGGAPKTNGITSSDVMVIDSEEEDTTQSSAKPPTAEFADEYDEVDLDEPYEKILKTLDIPLSSVRDISFPYAPSNISQVAPGAYPPILSSHLVVAVVSIDFSVSLVALPLTPPALSVDIPGKAGVQMVKLVGHQDIPTSISITHTSDEVDPQNRSRSRSRNRQAEETATSNKEWSFLIASTSPTTGGLLLIHEVPITKELLQVESSIPTQRQLLRSGTGCKVLFNPSVAPSVRHSNLLVILPSGLVKIYQCIQEQNARHPRSRRGSSGTMDSMTSKASSPFSGGKFLTTLYTPFSQLSIGRRKRVLDAAWVLGGTGILALLEDGFWGIWDIEGSAPDALNGGKPQNLLQGQNSHPAVLNGHILTQLQVKGRILPIDEMKQQDVEIKEKSTKLAPMTPHTRKIRSDGLFKTRHVTAGGTSYPAIEGTIGGISATPYSTRLHGSDDSILMFYGKQNILISSIQSMLRAQAQENKDSIEASAFLRPIAITSLVLPPSLPQTFISHLPSSPLRSTASVKPTLAFAASPSIPDIFVSTSHHLVFLCKPIEEPEKVSLGDATEDTGSEEPVRSLDFPQDEDQLLLTQGELDIDGMSRILDSMKNGPTDAGTPTKSKLYGRSIGSGRLRKGVGRR